MKKNEPNKDMTNFFNDHDHDACFGDAMEEIENHCYEKNLQFTPLRRKVFEFLLRDHKPLGAYEILDLLREEGFASTPPIAYRVLDFLMEQGFVHKIQGLNAFVACSNPGSSHSPAFMICRKCEKVAELDEKISGINLKKSTPSNFKLEESIIEMRGICTSCSSAELT